MALLSRLIVLVAALLPLLPLPATAQESYPTRPIRLIVGFAAGSSGDVAARIIGHKLGDILGQSVIVENRPGASSMIATDVVARAPKDGYTLLLATVAATINTTLMPGKGANLEKDLAPIALVGSSPYILVVNPSVGVNDLKGLIALAKEKPDLLLYGASGIGSGPQLTAELFRKMAGIQMTAVLYPGSAQQLTDLIAGRIHVMFAPASTVLGHIQQGTIKALATTQARRASVVPDLPTISEAAIPGFDTGIWFGILAPAGTPDAVIGKLSKATNDALKDADVLQQLHRQGLDALGGSPGDFRRFIRSETERWAGVIHDMDDARKK